jgi:hypothetical protein
VPRPGTGTKTKLGPGTAVDLTGGTNSTEERKTGKNATQYRPTTQTKTATVAELYRAAPRRISSRQHWTWAEKSRTNQKPNPRSSNTKKRTTLREAEKRFFFIEAQKGLHIIHEVHCTSSLIWLLELKN